MLVIVASLHTEQRRLSMHREEMNVALSVSTYDYWNLTRHYSDTSYCSHGTLVLLALLCVRRRLQCNSTAGISHLYVALGITCNQEPLMAVQACDWAVEGLNWIERILVQCPNRHVAAFQAGDNYVVGHLGHG